MPVDNEIDSLVKLVSNAVRVAATTDVKAKIGGDYLHTITAGVQAATTLLTLFLSDVKRIADAQEILARQALDDNLFKGK